MKEYMNRLARGNFLYQKQKLILEAEHIDGTITAGEIGRFSFLVQAKEAVKGIVHTEHERVKIETEHFMGASVDIVYTVDATGLTEGNTIEGTFCVVSDAGEAVITYTFAVKAEAVSTSAGEAHTMFHFANLVQMSPEEAAAIFQSIDFKHIFLKDDLSLCNIYDALRHTANVQEAMEEFLIAVRKKSPVTISISHENRVYTDFTETQKEVLTIQRASWGHVAIDVCTDGDFIEAAVKHIESEDFTGNRYELEYMLHADKMHAGKNLGSITIRTFTQELMLRIEAEAVPNKQDNTYIKEAVLSLTKEYLEFRMKRQDQKSWLDNSMRILDRIRGLGCEDSFFMLAQAQVLVIQNRTEEAGWLIEHAAQQIESDIDNQVELYCYYLYVKALYEKDEAFTAEAVQKIRRYYENGYDTWRILWILFYIDASEDQNKSIKLIRIKDAFHNGCTSPIMYYEALHILNTQPSLLRVFNAFEIQVLQFGCKYNLIDSKLILHACELISAEKVANIRYLKLLGEFYKLLDSDDVLAVLVTHMIRNELTGLEYISIYEKGILRGLRITRLYEFYMESLDKKNMKRLPQIVLRYFTYGSQLSDSAKAYLYANIIYNHSNSQELMEAFGAQIERFAYEQMRAGHIDDNRILIYKYVLQDSVASEEMTSFLARFLFTYKITVFEENISSVLIKHKEMRRGVRCQVVNNTAYVQMYTKDCMVLFEDDKGNIRKGGLQYEIERVYPREKLMGQVCAQCSNDLYIRLYLYEQAVEQHFADENIYQICLLLMESGHINEQTRNQMNYWLIQYYHDRELEEFFTGFEKIHKDKLNKKGASLLIETCINYEMYEDAFDLVKKYGYGGVATIKLLHMLRGMIAIRPKTLDKVLLSCCEHAFFDGKYDENVLKYMETYYNAATLKMLKVWHACVGFHLPCAELSERLIAQMLFTGNFDERLFEVFAYYYQNGTEQAVITAYIGENAYQYFVKKKNTDKRIFDYITDYIMDNRELPRICYVAYLAYYAKNIDQLRTDTQKDILQQLLNSLCRDKIFFEFYADYKDILSFPYNGEDLTTVEYRGNPGARVQIFYRYQDEQEYHSEVLKCVVGGVYPKSFTLFYGDTVQYYFEEEYKGEKHTTENSSMTYSGVASLGIENRFDSINEMLVSMEMHDMTTLKKIMQGYCVQDYITQELFKPI